MKRAFLQLRYHIWQEMKSIVQFTIRFLKVIQNNFRDSIEEIDLVENWLWTLTGYCLLRDEEQ